MLSMADAVALQKALCLSAGMSSPCRRIQGLLKGWYAQPPSAKAKIRQAMQSTMNFMHSLSM